MQLAWFSTIVVLTACETVIRETPASLAIWALVRRLDIWLHRGKKSAHPGSYEPDTRDTLHRKMYHGLNGLSRLASRCHGAAADIGAL